MPWDPAHRRMKDCSRESSAFAPNRSGLWSGHGMECAGVMIRQEHKVEEYEEEECSEECVILWFDVTVAYRPPKGRDPYNSEHIFLGVYTRGGHVGRVDSDGYAPIISPEPAFGATGMCLNSHSPSFAQSSS